MVNRVRTYLVILLTISCTFSYAQDKINWMTFEELDTQLAKQPKKVLLYFHADWCVYCKKMDRKVFTNPELIKLMNKNYYAVSFDAESETEVRFGNKTYVNTQVGSSRTPLHQIAQILATREGEFVAPTLVILDQEFKIYARYFEYMTSDELIKILN